MLISQYLASSLTGPKVSGTWEGIEFRFFTCEKVNLDDFSPEPSIDGKGSHGGYCGPAVKPIALNMVAEIARDPETAGLPISGIGGVTTWRDAAEFISLREVWLEQAATYESVSLAAALQPASAGAAGLPLRLDALPGASFWSVLPRGLGVGGDTRPVRLILGGDDYEKVAGWARELVDAARDHPALVSPRSGFEARQPRLDIRIDRDRASDLGVSPAAVGRTLETMLGAREITTYTARDRDYPVVLQGRAQGSAEALPGIGRLAQLVSRVGQGQQRPWKELSSGLATESQDAADPVRHDRPPGRRPSPEGPFVAAVAPVVDDGVRHRSSRGTRLRV